MKIEMESFVVGQPRKLVELHNGDTLYMSWNMFGDTPIVGSRYKIDSGKYDLQIHHLYEDAYGCFICTELSTKKNPDKKMVADMEEKRNCYWCNCGLYGRRICLKMNY